MQPRFQVNRTVLGIEHTTCAVYVVFLAIVLQSRERQNFIRFSEKHIINCIVHTDFQYTKLNSFPNLTLGFILLISHSKIQSRYCNKVFSSYK